MFMSGSQILLNTSAQERCARPFSALWITTSFLSFNHSELTALCNCILVSLWWDVEFSILHMPELVSFTVGLMIDVFQRSSIRVPAVMTAVGEGAVNCSKLCSGLVKS